MKSKIYRRETLYSKNSKEQVIEWNIELKKVSDGLFEEYLVSMYSGLFGRSRLNKPDTFLVKEGKNIGKSNETTSFQQAANEAKAKWQHKIDREGYISLKEKGIAPDLSMDTTEALILKVLPKHKSYIGGKGKPMKAVSLKDIKLEKLVFPYLYQHKLNGVRCDGDSDFKLTSKDGIDYDISQIKKELELLYEKIDTSIILDGELYHHGWILSKILSAVRKTNPDSQHLEFWVFDLKIEEVKQTDRLILLAYIAKQVEELGLKYIKVLGFDYCYNYEEMLKQTDDSIALGYEGAIFRSVKAEYQFGKRNMSIIKSKKFFDGEFKILDIIPHKKNPKLGSLLLLNDINTLKFISEFTGSEIEKAEMLKNKKNYIGKKATVKYYERTVTSLPFHTQVIAIRDYE